MNFKRMGVMNVTPNSFSDGGELSPDNFLQKLKLMGHLDALDIGAESTAPMNEAISWMNEWQRLLPYMPLLKGLKCVLSFDTYHPETIEEILRYYRDHHFDQKIFWNDVSGKFDDYVKAFLSASPNFSYVFCHNLAPSRDLSGKHMDYVDEVLTFDKLRDFFLPHKSSQVIFDPCLGFSKTYEQNWEILNRFSELQELCQHDRWVLGFSRKSFLRKKYGLTLNDRDELDRVHDEVLAATLMSGEVWVRAH